MKPKLQSSRKQQFHSPNGESFLRSDTDNREEHGEELWPKRSKKDDDPPNIISGTLAAATAACYSPQPGGSNNNSPTTSNGSGPSTPQLKPVTSTPPVVAAAASTSSSPVVQTKEQIFKSKLSPQLLSKIQQNMSNAGHVVANKNQPMSPNGKGVTRMPVPKLMSRTKAQYQLLRSQVQRPKPKPGAGVAAVIPKNNEEQPSGIAVAQPQRPTNVTFNPTAFQAKTNPKLGSNLQKADGLSTITIHKQQLKPPGVVVGGGNKATKLPPPTTVVAIRTASLLDSVAKNQLGLGARRGGATVNSLRGGRGRSEAIASARGGRGKTAVGTLRRETQPPSPSQSGGESGSDSDEYGYSTPSPPPTKTFRTSKSVSPAASRGKNKTNNKPSPRNTSTTSPQKKKEVGDERVYGKDYKCPAMDKVASYLTKKGERIWICLVCEEPEQEISRGPMICCDGCDDWYHMACVGLDDEPPENEKWFCKRCIFKKLHTKKLAVDKSDTDSESEEEEDDEEEEEEDRPKGRTSPLRSRNNKGRGTGSGRGGGRGGRGRGGRK
ncbi:inhibitor of growth protein 3 isoform X2 [Folsomia candida]|nr:inhibitor of growth protein 3 isoform X2 [Folsomia candida]